MSPQVTGNASGRVMIIIIGNTRRLNIWAGIAQSVQHTPSVWVRGVSVEMRNPALAMRHAKSSPRLRHHYAPYLTSFTLVGPRFFRAPLASSYTSYEDVVPTVAAYANTAQKL